MRAAGSSASIDRDNHRQRSLDGLYTAIDHALDGSLTIFHGEDFLGVCHLIEAQLLSHLRTHLSRIAINGLTTSNDYVHIANLLDGSGEGVRSGQRVGTGKETVGQEPTRISAPIKSLTDNLSCTWRTHRQYSYSRSWMLLLQAKSLLQGIQIFGIEDGG